MILKLKGFRAGGKVILSCNKKYTKHFPPRFHIELETIKVKERLVPKL